MTPGEKDKTYKARTQCRFKYAMSWMNGNGIVYYAKCGLKHGKIVGWECECHSCNLYKRVEELIKQTAELERKGFTNA